MRFACVLLVSGVLAMAGCSALRPEACPYAAAPADTFCPTADEHDEHAATPDASNDAARLRTLEREATKLITDKTFTPMADLVKQLSRKKAALKLPAVAAVRTPGEVYTRSRDGVLVVAAVYKCDRCSRWHVSPASGFVISATGAFVTNYHVVKDKSKHTVVAMTHAGEVYPVKEVLAASESDDCAILQLDVGNAKLTPLPLSPDAPVGSAVNCLSHPNRRFYYFSRGIVSRYTQRGRAGKTATMMSITADFARGSSGAPVLNDRGAVVGLVSSTSSIYYTVTKDKQENLQMVIKLCVPARSVLNLIGK